MSHDTASKKIQYTVITDDNYSWSDGGTRYKYGSYDTCEEAQAACRKVVDHSLDWISSQGYRGEDLISNYRMYGDDAFIIVTNFVEGDYTPSCAFDAKAYAESKYRDIERKVWRNR